IWDGIKLFYKKNIKSYNVAVYAPIYNFNRKFLLDNFVGVTERIYGAGEKEKIDELDWNLIKIYATNVRQSYLEIAKKLNVSPDTV
ncbi:MAG: AsnC family protein, partial [Nanoarchaeota archaeon]